MDKRDIGILAILFLIAFYVWTIPFHDNRMPFGENDAAWHFAIGDSMYDMDRSIAFRDFPNYIDYWYYNFNKILGPGTPQYPPPNHLNIAMVQSIGNERFLPVFIYRAVASFLAVFSVYFLVRKLYGIFPAFLASFGLIFSIREAMVYLWGQTATLLPIIFIPLVLYAFYKYYTSLYGKEELVYLYILTLLLGAQYLLHMQGLVVSAVILPFSLLFITLNHRKIPKLNFRHLGICAVIFVIIAAPFALIYAGSFAGQLTAQPTIDKIARITTWGINKEMIQGAFPNFFVEFSAEYSMVMLPFLLLGILFLVLRRQDKDMLMLSWVAAMYFILHIDVFMGAAEGRAARMVLAETQIFYALMALGIAFLASFARENKLAIKLGIAAAFILLIGMTTGKAFYNNLNDAYPAILRLTPQQMEAAEWIGKNLPENAVIYDLGTLTYQKTRWMLAASRRHVLPYRGEFKADFTEGLELHNYFMADYSDISRINDPRMEQQSAAIRQVEQQLNKTPVYDKSNIRIYDLG